MVLSGLPSAVRGALWMGCALLAFSLMAVAVRELILRTLGTFEIVFLRSLVSLVIVLAMLPWFGMRALRTRLLGVHVVRNVFQFGSQYAWVYAIGLLPLAIVFAIEFTMPVWATVLAVLILGERLDRSRVVMLALGLAGILIILKPGIEQVSPAALVMLAGSIAYAAMMVTTKHLAGRDTAFAVLFYMSAMQVPVGLFLALPAWVTPELADLPWIIALGASGFGGHYCLTRALRAADATLIASFDFLRLPLIAVIGFALYGEPLELSTLLGAAVIFSGTYYSIRRASRG